MLTEKEAEDYNELSRLERIHYNLQWSCKILLNSIYGCLACQYFRGFDRDVASAVTLSGQTIIKNNGELIQDYFENEVCNLPIVRKNFKVDDSIKDVNVRLYTDTDSLIFDTKINTNNGIYRIGDLYNMYENKNKHLSQFGHEIVDVTDEDLTCLTYNEKTNKADYGKIKKLVRHKVTKKKWRIKVDGKEVIVTEDHACMIKRHGDLLRVKPSEINKKTDKIITIF